MIVLLTLNGVGSGRQDHLLPLPEYCKHYEYPVETHLVKTEDGFVLQYFRVQAKRTEIKNGLPVVLLHHGLVDSADTFIVNSEDKAPAFILANRGFDVWLGNSRGNKYSKNPHFEFSFDDMADKDLPAGLSYIRNATGRKIHYVGHSQGTTILFAALSRELPQVEEHLIQFIALGPVAHITHQRSPLFKHPLTWLINGVEGLGIHYFLKSTKAQSIFTSEWCKVVTDSCLKVLRAISEDDPSLVNRKRLPTIMGHFPAGTSVRNLQHWNQMILNNTFRSFDYGEQGNQQHYGTTTPPAYPLEKVRLPVHLFVGLLDKLADVQDSEQLFSELTGAQNKSIKLLRMGHAGFIWNQDMSWFQEVVQLLQK